MHRNPFRRPGSICLLLLALAWCGVTVASEPVQLALSGTQATPLPTTVDDAHIIPASITPWIQVKVKPGDTLSGLFGRVDLGASQWRAMLALGDTVDPMRHLKPGDTFRLRKTPDGRLAALHFAISATRTLIIRRTSDGLTAHLQQRKTRTRQIRVSGTVGHSLSGALRDAGVPGRTANALARIFQWRHKLSRTIQPGDRFSIIYAARFVGGEQVHVGPIIAASIHTHDQVYRAFRQVDDDGKAHYYDSHGHSYRPSFLRTPVKYSYVSSPFSMHRRHPKLGIVRPHEGVDLASRRGTPIHAAADGVVTYVGWLHGYGRIVKLDNGGGYSTRYAHMSRFANKLHKGEHVKQGQVIGYVGESGMATGYHLHFEIRKNGVPHDPLKMKLPEGKPLTGETLTAFTDRIQPLMARLAGTDTSPRTLVATSTTLAQQQSCARTGTINALLALAPDQVTADALSQVFCAAAG